MKRALPLGLLAVVVFNPAVQAQSTMRLGRAEPPLRAELSIGMDRPHGYGSEGGTVTSAAIGVRYTRSGVGIRASVQGIRRRVVDVYSYNPGIEYDSVDTEHRVLALSLDTDVSWHIWGDLTLSPSVGAGFTPYAHGQQSTTRVRVMPDVTPYDYGNYSSSDAGVIWTLGLAARYRRLVLEKKAIGVLGARNSIRQGREYYPWTIGYRF